MNVYPILTYRLKRNEKLEYTTHSDIFSRAYTTQTHTICRLLCEAKLNIYLFIVHFNRFVLIQMMLSVEKTA